MKHYKIIETGANYPDVLLYRDRIHEDLEVVNIFACGIVGDTENVFASETIEFENPHTAIAFIRCFDKIAAEYWCEDKGITYW